MNSVTHKILELVSNHVTDFLLKNGGMSNGYQTFASGRVWSNVTEFIDWSTPTIGRLTISKHKKMGIKLNEELRAILKGYAFPNPVYIEGVHLEDGCYRTRCYATVEEVTIDLYKRK